MLKNSLLLSWLIGTCLQAAAHDPVTKVRAPLKTVTVYRQGAALEHLGAAVLKAGSNELIIQGLSNTIDLNSLQVNCVAAVTIMGMEFRQNYLNEQQPTALVQILKDSVRVLEMELEKIAAQTTVTLELIDLLKTNRDLKGQQNGVSVSELVKLMDYYKTRAAELQQDLQAQKHKQQVRQAQLTKLQLQIAEEEKKNTR